MSSSSAQNSDHLLASGLVGEVCELVSGIDALYMSGWLPEGMDLSADRFAELLALKEAAGESDTPQVIGFGGEQFHVLAHGVDGYKVALGHEKGIIGITDSLHRPTFRVKPLASFLHSTNPIEAARWFCSTVDAEVGTALEWTVGRLDLFVDIQGYVFVDDDRHRLVCRPRHLHGRYEDGALNNLEVGRRTSGTMCARIYDKTLQVKDSGLDYWYEIWGDKFDPTQPVWRIEFEFLRRALKELGVTTLDDLPERIGELWAYATQNWLRLTVPSTDETRARWSTDPVWRVVQGATLRHDAVPAERIKAGQRAGTIRKLMPLLNGCVTSFAAAIDADTLDEALPSLIEHIEDLADWKGIDVPEQIRCKKAKR